MKVKKVVRICMRASSEYRSVCKLKGPRIGCYSSEEKREDRWTRSATSVSEKSKSVCLVSPGAPRVSAGSQQDDSAGWLCAATARPGRLSAVWVSVRSPPPPLSGFECVPPSNFTCSPRPCTHPGPTLPRFSSTLGTARGSPPIFIHLLPIFSALDFSTFLKSLNLAKNSYAKINLFENIYSTLESILRGGNYGLKEQGIQQKEIFEQRRKEIRKKRMQCKGSMKVWGMRDESDNYRAV